MQERIIYCTGCNMGKTWKDKKKWEDKQKIKKNKEKEKNSKSKIKVIKTQVGRFEWHDFDEI